MNCVEPRRARWRKKPRTTDADSRTSQLCLIGEGGTPLSFQTYFHKYQVQGWGFSEGFSFNPINKNQWVLFKWFSPSARVEPRASCTQANALQRPNPRSDSGNKHQNVFSFIRAQILVLWGYRSFWGRGSLYILKYKMLEVTLNCLPRLRIMTGLWLGTCWRKKRTLIITSLRSFKPFLVN